MNNSQEKNKKIFTSPLSRRLTVSIILLSSLVTLILTTIQLYWSYQSEMKGIETDLEQIENVHLKALSQSLWAANLKELNLQLEGMVKIPSIVYSAIYENERLWTETGQRTDKNIIEKEYPLVYLYKGQDIHIGTLKIVADVSLVYEHLINQAIVILASNAFKTFLVAAFMLFFFHRQVNRFLVGITDYLSKSNIQNDDAPLSLGRPERRTRDEFDFLVSAINDMLSKNKRIHKELNDSHERVNAIANYTIDWESWFDPNGKLIWVNPSVTRMTGYTPDECYAMQDFPLPFVATLSDQQRLRQELERARGGNIVENLEFQILTKDGRHLWMAISWQPIKDANLNFSGFRSSVRDISSLKQIEAQLSEKISELNLAENEQKRLLLDTEQERARMTSLLAAMNIGILFEDIENRIMYFNPSFRRIWLIPEKAALVNKKTREVLEHSANVLSKPDHFSKHILHTEGTHEVSESFELEMADGRIITQVSYPVHDKERRLIGRLWIYEDVTHERQTAEQLIYLAERDSLTGLYNRHRFQEELARMMADISRRKTHGALLFFDLDEFKYINDNFGHRAGDAMLIRVAGEVSALVRRNEIFARIGGDEFAILMPDATETTAKNLAERIIRSIGQVPFQFENQNLRLTTSLGIALYPDHGANAEELVSRADAAMYQAKEAGKNAWRVYDVDFDTSKEMLNRLTWNERISNALEHNLLQLHFQGIYCADSGRLCHLEALVRMKDETDLSRVIMPGHFIQAAEKTGKIVEIDRWVVQESIALLAENDDIPAIAINISGRSFDDIELPTFIEKQLWKTNVNPDRLHVELTETAAVTDLHDAQRFIERLRQTGCHVCLDDFGSGFSSFAYLKHLRVDVLKIDGLFVRDLPNDRDNQIFVKSIVDVAKGMNKKTIAEFVEDQDTLDMLRRFGVDMIQGYHLDMPKQEFRQIETVSESF